jgi:hypothetical protein
MKKLTTVIMVLSLVLGGVALAAAADLPQTSKNLDLSAMQKISDQEAQQIRGTGNFGSGICLNTCIATPNSVNNVPKGDYLNPKNYYTVKNWGGNSTRLQ